MRLAFVESDPVVRPAPPGLWVTTKGNVPTRKRAFGVTPARVIEGGKNRKPETPPVESRVVTTYECTDTGNAERLAARFGDRIRYVAAWDTHLVYTGTHWKRDTKNVHIGRLAKQTIKGIDDEKEYEDSAGKKRLSKWQKSSYARAKLQAMIALVRHEDGIAVEHTDLDSDPWLLNTLSGTLDLRTGKVRPHSPHDNLMKVIPVAYNERAKALRWERFLREVLPAADVRAFLQRFLGYCLTGDVSERTFVMFLGDGKNGKTVFLEAIKQLLGPYSAVAAPTLLVAKDWDSHPTEVADLFGARLAISSELKKGTTFDEERLKRLTGGDCLKARRMFEDNWEFDPTHKLAIATNHKPRVKDATSSFWDRCVIVPFTVRIAANKVDRGLGSKLKEEREGILLWMLKGLELWRKEGLERPTAVQEATQEYRDEEDIAGRFLNECVALDKKAFTLTADLMSVNDLWMKAQGMKYQLNAKELSEKLRAEPYRCAPHRASDGKQGWKGIRLTKVARKN